MRPSARTLGLTVAICILATAGPAAPHPPVASDRTASREAPARPPSSRLAAPSGTGRLRNKARGLCLDVAGWSAQGDGNVLLWECNDDPDQVWRFAPGGELVNALDGRCLDVSDYDGAKGRNVGIHRIENLDDQRWTLAPRGPGLFELRNRKQDLCLDVDGTVGKMGDDVLLWACDGGIDQLWWWDSIAEQAPRRDVAPTAPGESGTIVGDWDWSDGARTAFRADGTFVTPTDASGTWRRGRHGFEVLWGDSRVAHVRLSADQTMLVGAWKVRGADQPVSARRPPGWGRRVAQPPPTPRPAPRDCGTGADDAGCQESRNGVRAMERDAWSGLFSTAQATASDHSRRQIIVAAVSPNGITARQLMMLLDLFRSDLTKVEVVRAVVARIVDPERALAYGPRMRSAINREHVVKLLSTARTRAPDEPVRAPGPSPQVPGAPEEPPGAVVRPPQKRCPPQPACGIACQYGYAKDANGCGLCACLPNPLATRRP